MVGRLMAHASFARHLAHTKPVKPSLLDQSKTRLQHFLAEIRRISHKKLFKKKFELPPTLNRQVNQLMKGCLK
jgi:hypothetical protein